MTPTVRILGTRGVPSQHGGFETAAQQVGTELVRRGWRVIVYCQSERQPNGFQDTWQGIERVHFRGRFDGAPGTMLFDARATRHAAKHRDLCLVLGYNTAFLNAQLRAHRVPVVINMDGIEWQRERWSTGERLFLRANEHIGSRIGCHLIADHPEIASHLSRFTPRSKITMIPYGAPEITAAPTEHLRAFGVEPGGFVSLIARPVPENSILEIVRGFSRSTRGVRLLVLGTYDPADRYHRAVQEAAGDEVVFAGPVYDPALVGALRFHSLAYLHGHRVGGTNPSLVEALGAGNPVIAHDNPFNRWVAQGAAVYFADQAQFEDRLEAVLGGGVDLVAMARSGRERHADAFTWPRITDQYEQVLRDAMR